MKNYVPEWLFQLLCYLSFIYFGGTIGLFITGHGTWLFAVEFCVLGGLLVSWSSFRTRGSPWPWKSRRTAPRSR